MTGFGKAVARFDTRTITVAIKSLNSKQADLSVRIASAYREGELELRALIADRLQRGKIDISITMEEAAQRFQPGMGQPAIFSTDRRAMCSQRVPTRWVALVMIRS